MTERSMKERIARALCTHNFQDPDAIDPLYPHEGVVWLTYRREAEALLQELLSPTPLMIEAVIRNGSAAGTDQIQADFQAAIQAALDEPIMEGAH